VTVRRLIEPDRLLGYLTSRRAIREVEVAATTGLAWLLSRYPDVRRNLGAHLDSVGIRVGAESVWRAEHRTDSGGRADLAAVAPDESVEARIEAKFGAQLAVSQILDYLRVANGARLIPVVVLHPADRQREIDRRIAEVREVEPQSDIVSLTWDRLCKVLIGGLDRGPARADVEQLRSLAAAATALDIPPFPDGVVGNELHDRIDDLQALAEAASRFAGEKGKLWPYRNLSPGLESGRYFALGGGLPEPAVGIRVGWVDQSPDRPIWLRFHSRTDGFDEAVDAWEKRRDNLGGDREYGHLFIPLELPRDIGGQDSVRALQVQVVRICEQLIGISPTSLEVDGGPSAMAEATDPV
jgi:hypothetical protein